MNIQKIAKITGSAILIMAVLSAFSITALGTVKASLGLTGIFILDLLVSIGIYQIHRNAAKSLALSTCAMRLFYTFILGIAIVFHFKGNLSIFNQIWNMGLIIFGVHLILLSTLIHGTNRQKWNIGLIAFLLLFAGIGYIIQHTGKLLIPHFSKTEKVIESVFLVPMILCEIIYAFWLLIYKQPLSPAYL